MYLGLFLQPHAVGREVVARAGDILARFMKGSYMTVMAYDDLVERGAVIINSFIILLIHFVNLKFLFEKALVYLHCLDLRPPTI